MTASPSDVSTPKTLRDHVQALAGAAFIVGLTLLGLELLLRLVDPWGLRYFSDLEVINNKLFTYDEARGYILPEGEQRFSLWGFTIRDQARFTPNTPAQAACRIAILGDSVAFGYGVDDAQTWLNLVAAAWPQVQFVNYAVPRYSIGNIAATYDSQPDYDGYLYLLINNDAEAPLDVRSMSFSGGGSSQPMLIRYANFAIFRGGGTDRIVPPAGNTATAGDTPEVRALVAEVRRLVGDERLRVAAFRDEALTNTLLTEGLPIALLDYPPDRISVADYHLNPEGNRKLAAQMRPLFESLISDVCATP